MENLDENQWRQDEAFSLFERLKPLVSEYFDDWIITGRRAGCGTKVIIGDYSKKETRYEPTNVQCKKMENKLPGRY